MLRGGHYTRGRVNTTRHELRGPEGTFVAEVAKTGDGYEVKVGDRTYSVRLKPGREPDKLVVEMANKPVAVTLRAVNSQMVELSLEGESIIFQRPSAVSGPSPLAPTPAEVSKGTLTSPMPGRVISVVAKEGDKVSVGEPLVVIESMKMETAIRSDREGVVESVLVSEGASVKRGQALIKFSG